MSATSTPQARPAQFGVLGATASGRTQLSAFHRALVAVGLGHYNLVRLSSVIPPGVEVRQAEPAPFGGTWGDRLYCVYAEQRTSTPGEEAWAGVGWVQRLDGGGGLFVEHEGPVEAEVTDAILASLADMVDDEEHAYAEAELVVVGVRCEDQPVCALAIVPYVSRTWER